MSSSPGQASALSPALKPVVVAADLEASRPPTFAADLAGVISALAGNFALVPVAPEDGAVDSVGEALAAPSSHWVLGSRNATTASYFLYLLCICSPPSRWYSGWLSAHTSEVNLCASDTRRPGHTPSCGPVLGRGSLWTGCPGLRPCQATGWLGSLPRSSVVADHRAGARHLTASRVSRTR